MRKVFYSNVFPPAADTNAEEWRFEMRRSGGKSIAKKLSAIAIASALLGVGAAPAPNSSGGDRSLWDQDSSYVFERPGLTWGRDPFGKKPGFAESAESEPEYTVSAVIFDGPRSEAIVNDRRVRVGDEVGWRYVDEIGPNYVLLSNGDSTIEANLSVSRSPAGRIQLEEVRNRP